MEDFAFQWFADFEVPEGFSTTQRAHDLILGALKTGPISADQIAVVLLKTVCELEHRILMAETRLGG